VKGTTFNVVFTVLYILLCGNSAKISCRPQSSVHQTIRQDQKRSDNAVAVVNGRLAITEREVDQAVGAQLYNLQERIYDLRKRALENLLIQIVLKNEAEQRGITVEKLRNELMPDKVEVRQSDIDQRYADNLGTLENMNEDEAKQRIKLDLESRLRFDRYQAAISEIMSRAKIEILLSEPAPALSAINTDGPSKGPRDAPVTIVEFSDFQCPFCKDAAVSLKNLMLNYGPNVRLVFKQMPLPIHPDAFKAARASVCADEQGAFWEYHNALFGSSDLSEQALSKYASDLGLRTDQFKSCLASETSAAAVRKDIQQAALADVQGTPTFFINGRLVRGMKSLEDFSSLIDRALTQSRREGKPTSQ
jgi:protein-disulfide isomerase